jgi:hypothetical protein
MTTLTLRYIKGDFLVTGPDIEPRKFVRVAPSGQELEDDSSSRVSVKEIGRLTPAKDPTAP